MRIWENGVIREMTEEEALRARQEQAAISEYTDTEERIRQLEEALALLLSGETEAE